MPPLARHHFAGQHIALIVDGDDAQTAFLKSTDGGLYKASTTEEPGGGYHLRGKHATVRELEALSFEFGMSGAKWALGLVQKIVNTPGEAHVPFNGSIIHADSNFRTQYTYEFMGARVTEFTLPKLDAKSKESAYLKVKCQPETMDFSIDEGAKLNPGAVDRQKQWVTSAFDLTLSVDGIVLATSIEALTVKVGAKAYQIGGVQNPQYTATGKLEMPKLSFVVPMMHCKKVLTWFKKAIVKEGGLAEDTQYEQDAIIDYLDPSKKKTLYTIKLLGIGPETFSVVKGSNEATAAIKFDCYVTGMELEASGEGII
ncbi:MAG: hypothetical protein K8M05_04645 [Deltaproteobacteria bacterium]|nr:hypothetical protein [Kofleriaceae bacterium]